MGKMSVAYYLDLQDRGYHEMFRKSLTSLIENVNDDCEIHLVTGVSIAFDKSIIEDVDKIHRINLENGYYTRNKHKGYAEANIEGDVLYLDVDTIVQKSIDHVFRNKNFTIALPRRNSVIRGAEFNSGVVFLRDPSFWLELYEANIHRNALEVERYFSSLARQDRWKLHVISDLYNWAPNSKEEDVSNAYIVHYKGPRKSWMI